MKVNDTTYLPNPSTLHTLVPVSERLSRMPPCISDVEVGEHLLRRFIFVHLSEDEAEHAAVIKESETEKSFRSASIGQQKFDLLVVMLRKLYAFVTGDVMEDNADDSLMNQEILTPGHLYLMIVKEKIEEFINGLKLSMIKDRRANRAVMESRLHDLVYYQKIMARQGDIGEKMKYFLATGNLVSTSGLDLMQASGYTVVAEKLNYYRYLAHFRSVHRGAFFTTMKTTTVRKLLPESWGFLCPVHTPDGGPCGLLQHLSSSAAIVCEDPRINQGADTVESLRNLFSGIGMNSLSPSSGLLNNAASELTIVLDGRVMGSIPAEKAERFVENLRTLKVLKQRGVPPSLEIAYFPPVDAVVDMEEKGNAGSGQKRKRRGPYPGIYLATAAARLVRPVWNRRLDQEEILGPMEQVFLDIACTDDECLEEEKRNEGSSKVLYGKAPTHVEITPTNMLSVIASLTPFSDFNQSPRNMYQCQMGKQTMGTPAHSLVHRTDTKLYRIQTPQAPIVQNKGQEMYGMDEYPNGTNAVVCVISYTGYDMEDAMILNKSSMERGFGHGTVYKTLTFETVPSAGEYFGNVDPRGSRKARVASPADNPNGVATKTVFNDDDESTGTNGATRIQAAGAFTSVIDDSSTKLFYKSLDKDGLPPVGAMVHEGEPLCSIINESTGKSRVMKHKSSEPAYIDEVRLVSENKVKIKLRFNRNPIVGDKFSSRHGQKGVCSVLWPHQDMPLRRVACHLM